jgi:hypothetical protein
MSTNRSITAVGLGDDDGLTAVKLEAPGVREAIERRALVEHVDKPMAALELGIQDVSNKIKLCESIVAGHSVNSGSRGGHGSASSQKKIPKSPGLLHRVKHRPPTQLAIVQHEHAHCSDESRPKLCDKGCICLADYWQLYVTKWRPLEQQHGSSWRSDRQIPGHYKMNSRGTWWGIRKPIYTLVEHYMAHDGLSEEEALNTANETYCSVPRSTRNGCNGRRPIKAVAAAFKAKIKELGINRPLGRPPGLPSRR